MNIKTIKSEAAYAAAMARVSKLMAIEPADGSKEAEELDLLALVIEDYERKIVSRPVADPIEAILFRMDQMNIKRKDLVPYIGSLSKVSEVLTRKRPLSLSMIRRLHQGLNIPAEVLIGGAEGIHSGHSEESELDYTKFPLKEMYERGCFGDFKGSAKKLKDHAERLIRKLTKDMPNNASPVLLRAPMHQRGGRALNDYALLAWRLCVLRKARAANLARDYKKGTVTLKWLRDLAKLSAFERGPALAKEYLNRHGIAFVIEPHFKKTFLDGAAMLDRGTPIVALTLRHDRIDNFWFALMHELAHVSKHLDDKHPLFVDNLDNDSEPDRVEREADEMASEALIPGDVWAKAEVRKTHSVDGTTALGEKLGIHPGIVAGRIRHETKNYRLMASLVGHGGVSGFFA